MAVDYVAFGVVVDDIVFPDGRIVPGVLGGGGPQAAFGMRLWAERVGLVAAVGHDFPPEHRRLLEASAIDLAGVRVTDRPTPRAWQVYHADGRYEHRWRTPVALSLAQVAHAPEYVPPSYRHARGYHLGVHPDAPDLRLLAALRSWGALVSVETFRPAPAPLPPPALSALLSACDVFSANIVEARSLVVPSPRAIPSDAALAARLADAGASVVVLRMGSEGSLVYDRATGQTCRAPAVPVPAVDPTGGGNAYCGAFLVGYVETGDLRQAALRGAVAASFLVERVGLPVVDDDLRAEAQQRLEALTHL